MSGTTHPASTPSTPPTGLVKAYRLNNVGTVYTREPQRDIPLSQDHYRSNWEVQGIWGNDTHIWVSAAVQRTNTDRHAAAYSRSDFTRDLSRSIPFPERGQPWPE